MNIFPLVVIQRTNIIHMIHEFQLCPWSVPGANRIQVWFKDIEGKDTASVTPNITKEVAWITRALVWAL